MRIRVATAADVEAITAIYGDAVLRGTGTFEIEPPDAIEMEARRTRIADAGYPFLVATASEVVLGYAYGFAYRDRPAYRYTVENSVYVDKSARSKGVGRALLDALIVATTARGFRQMVAVIGDSANEASIRLHHGAGFSRVGTLAALGWKGGRWLDVVLMQRALGEGCETSPVDCDGG